MIKRLYNQEDEVSHLDYRVFSPIETGLSYEGNSSEDYMKKDSPINSQENRYKCITQRRNY